MIGQNVMGVAKDIMSAALYGSTAGAKNILLLLNR